MKSNSRNNGMVQLSIDSIILDPEQPRKTIIEESIQELGRGLRTMGQIHPITVRPIAAGKYMVVVGERRYRAAQEAGLKYIDCIIRNDIDDQKAKEMQLAENNQREDVSPLDQAWAIKNYLDKYKVSQRELSRRTGLLQRTISDRLALLSLPLSVHAQIQDGSIGPYEAVKISKFPTEKQTDVADAISSGRIGGVKLDRLLDLAGKYPDKSIKEIIEELGNDKIMENPIEKGATNSSVLSKVSPTNSDNKIRQYSHAEMSTKVVALMDVIQFFAEFRRWHCRYFDKNTSLCSYFQLESEQTVSENVGFLVKCGGKWQIKPMISVCAFCIADDPKLRHITETVLNDPFSLIRSRFKCKCGVSEKLVIVGRCGECRGDVVIFNSKLYASSGNLEDG